MYGMSKRLGTINYSPEEGFIKPFSEKTGKIIDEEISLVIDECYKRCKEMLTEKKHLVEKLAEELLRVETMNIT